jgi:hypothetical protein
LPNPVKVVEMVFVIADDIDDGEDAGVASSADILLNKIWCLNPPLGYCPFYPLGRRWEDGGLAL